MNEHRTYRARRADGLCPACGERPRQILKSGRVGEYCAECRKQYQREWYAAKKADKAARSGDANPHE